MGELYDVDGLQWPEHQARLLRRLAADKPANERNAAGCRGRGRVRDELLAEPKPMIRAARGELVAAFLPAVLAAVGG